MIQGRWLFRGLIALVTCVAAWLRLDDLGGPSLWLDEILNVGIIRSLENPGIVGWIIGFERENGPLYYAIHALAMKFPLAIETAFRIPSAILGIAAVPAIAYAAWKVDSSRSAGLYAAILLAFSPLHVFYSREGRPYALLVLASIGVLIALTERAGRFRTLLLALSLFAAASSALTSAPLVLATVVILTIDFMHPREDRRATGVALAGAIAAALYLFFYLRFPRPADTLEFDERFASVGAIILNAFSVTSGETAILTPWSLSAALLGVIGFAAMRDRRAAHITLALAILPVVIATLALIATDHWFSVRYVIHGLAPFLVLVACGITAVARAFVDLFSRILPVFRAKTSVAAVIGLAMTSVFAVAAFPAARSEPLARADWRGIASTLAARAHDDDVVLTAGEWSAVSLRFYLAELGRPLDVRPVLGDVELARSTVGRRIGGWIVLGGWEDDGALREWACTLFTLAHDRREQVRLSWAPGFASFLQYRATPEDLQHFSATVQSRSGAIALGPGRELLKGEGWHDPGGPDSGWFRWVRKELSFLAPLPQGRSHLELGVIANPGPKLPQRMSVLMNREVIARDELSRAMQTYSIDLGSRPESSLEEIGLLFDWEYSPAEVDGTTDTRKIAAGIGSIAIRTDAAAPLPSVPLPLLFNVGPPRLTTLPTDEVCEGEIPWTRAGEENMRLRLGYGTDVSFDRSRASFAAAFVEALPPRECLSDRSFVTHVFALLLERYPDKVGETTYLAGLAHGWSRENVVCRVSRAEEFMRVYAEEGAGE